MGEVGARRLDMEGDWDIGYRGRLGAGMWVDRGGEDIRGWEHRDNMWCPRDRGVCDMGALRYRSGVRGPWTGGAGL